MDMMKNQHAILILREEVRGRRDQLIVLDEAKEEDYGIELLENLRNRVIRQIKELENSIEILETCWK